MNIEFTDEDKDLHARTRRIDLAHQGDFALGSVTVRPSLRTIVGPQGERVIEPKVMQVLVALADPVGTILSRDDLTERCWEGRLVGDTSINRVISLLRTAFREVACDAVIVENVPKVGYRLLLTEEPDAAESAETETKAADPVQPPWYRRNPAIAILGALLLLITGIAAMSLWQSTPSSPPERLRIAMLPLDLSEGVDPLYGTGLETELRSQFARVGLIEVTSGDSASHLLAKGLEPSEVGRKLKADYIWTGTLDVGPERVTLAANLVNVETDREVWNESLASAPDAAQFLPVRTARAMADALGRTVSEQVSESSVSNEDYSLYLTAMGLIKTRGDDQRVAALEILQQVTQRSPEFAAGWAGLAKAYYLLPEGDFEENDTNALELATFALRIDPESVDALKVAGMLSEESEQSLAYLKRAVELDPGDAEAWSWLGLHQREFQLDAERHLESTLRMVELDPLWPASWRASDHAAEFAQLDLARQLERDIGAAAVTTSQSLLAEARLARIDGDLSRYIELAQEVTPSVTETQRRFSLDVHLRMIEVMLGISLPVDAAYVPTLEKQLLYRMQRGDLPRPDEIASATEANGDLWDIPMLVSPAIPLFLETGRSGELLASYDARFETHQDFLAYAQETGRPEFMIPRISPFLAVALRDAGRNAEAEAHLASAEAYIARWKAADTGWILPILLEINLAAAKGEADRATELIETLPNFGWPYTQAHPSENPLLLLSTNPIFDGLRDLPEVRAVLDPIRAKLATERAEIQALGIS